MEKSKLNLGKIDFDEILSREEMREIMLGSGSGSGSQPQSACSASCTCPDGNKEFNIYIICTTDCRAVSEQGVECIENGVTKAFATCRSAYNSQCYYST